MKITTCPPVLQRIPRDPECFKEYVKYSAKVDGHLPISIPAILRVIHSCDRNCDVRVWIALISLYNSRAALAKKRHGEGRRLPQAIPWFGLENIQRKTGLRERSIKDALRRLAARQLISTWHPCEVVFPVLPLTGPALDGLMALPGRRRTGALSLPKQMASYLCRHGTKGTIAVALAHCIRCWGDGGRCSRKFVTKVFGISPYTAKNGRAKLLALGWLVDKEDARNSRGIKQPGRWKINRWGVETSIDGSWRFHLYPAKDRCKIASKPTGPVGHPSPEAPESKLALQKYPAPAPKIPGLIKPYSSSTRKTNHTQESRMAQNPPPIPGNGFPQSRKDGRTEEAREPVPIPEPRLRHPGDLTTDDLEPRARLKLWRRCNAVSEADKVAIDAACEHATRPGIKSPPGLFIQVLLDMPTLVSLEDGTTDQIGGRALLTNHDEDEGIRKRKACEPRAQLQPQVEAVVNRVCSWTRDVERPELMIHVQLGRDARELQRVRVKKETGWRLQLQCRGWDMDRITRADKELQGARCA